MEYGIYVDSLGTELGLRDGDKIIAIGGNKLEEFSPQALRKEIVLNNAKQIVVRRDSQDLKIDVDPKFVQLLSSTDYKDYFIMSARVPFVVKEVTAGGNASKAGLAKDDQIVYVDNRPAIYQHEVVEAFQKAKGQTVRLGYIRGGQTLEAPVAIDDKGKIGIALKTPPDFGWTGRKDYTLAQAIPAGFSDGVTFMGDWFKGISQLFKGKVKAKDSLGGFITITKLFSDTWDWESFWRITGILSFILAIMNLLPIPALDGGHVVFLLYEVITGRKPSDKFMEYSTYVGFAIVLGLLVLANGLDIMRLFGK